MPAEGAGVVTERSQEAKESGWPLLLTLAGSNLTCRPGSASPSLSRHEPGKVIVSEARCGPWFGLRSEVAGRPATSGAPGESLYCPVWTVGSSVLGSKNPGFAHALGNI